MIFGAYMTYKGNIFYSIVTYFFGDICWLINSYLLENYIGTILIFTGTILGVLAYFKISNGKMYKTINKG